MVQFQIKNQTVAMLRERLKQYGYNERTLCARLEIPSIYRVPFNYVPYFQIRRLEIKNDLVDILFLLFFFEEKVNEKDLLKLFSNEEITALVADNILNNVDDTFYKSMVAIHPYQDLCFFTNLNFTTGVPHEMDAVCYPISVESRYLARYSTKIEAENVLDLGTGCGIHAILAAAGSRNVVGIDLTPCAVSFARINASFNNVENVRFEIGSVFDPVNDLKFDSILSNPPACLPSTEKEEEIYGDKVLKTILLELKNHLSENGICQLMCHMVAPEDVKTEEIITQWIGDVPFRIEMQPLYHINYFNLLQKWLNVPLAGEQWCKCPADADSGKRRFAAIKWVDFLTQHHIKGQRGSFLKISWDKKFSIIKNRPLQEVEEFKQWR